MRRLFPLKPVSASNNNNNSSNSKNLLNSKADKDGPYFWESMVENGGDNLKENSLEAQMKRDYPYIARKHLLSRGGPNLSSPKDDDCSQPGQRLESSVHRRSQSSSSSIFSNNSVEINPSSLSDASKSSISSADAFVQGIECTPLAAMPNGNDVNRGAKTNCKKRPTSVPKGRPEANLDTPPSSPPQVLRCNSVHLTKVPDRIVDFRLAGKEEKLISGKAPSKIAMENELSLTSGRPPRFRPSSQVPVVNVKGLIRSQSFSEAKETYDYHENIGEKTSLKLHSGGVPCGNSVAEKFSFSARNVAERLVRSLPGKSKSKLNSFDNRKTSGRNTIAHSEFLESVPASGSDLGSHCSFCTEVSSPSRHFEESLSGGQEHSPEEQGSSNEEKWFPVGQTVGDGGSTHYVGQKKVDRDRFQMWLEGHEKTVDTNEDLERRAKAAEEQAVLLLKELESVSCYQCGITEAVGAKKNCATVELLQQKLRKICEEKRNMALEVSSEIRKRMAERSGANEALKLIRGEMESREKLMENEKNDLQLALEKELDRRSSEWATKLEKIRLEEKRLRDRVRDLAEQNVALQREVSSLNNREIDSKSQVRESQLYMDGFRIRLEEAENEIIQLRESLSESCKRAKQAEDDRDSIRRGYKEKERENYDLQKSVVRLQRLCKDQERTISGLRQELDDVVNDSPPAKSDHITKLWQEQLRLTGVEQALRKDLESCRCELDALRHENTNLLERVQSRESGSGFGLIKLDQELRARLDGLQAHALSLLDENTLLCAKLLEFIKSKVYAIEALEVNGGEYSGIVVGNDQERNSVLELEMDVQRLRRKVDSAKKSVRSLKVILKEKAHITCNESLRQHTQNAEAWKPEIQPSEVKEQLSELQQEFKAETLLVKLLREKLCSREVELEQLHEEVASLIRSQESLKSENVSLHDMLSIANHKEKDLELLLGAKDERISLLQADLQECLKELAFLRGELPKISTERDAIQQQAEHLGRQNMRLNAEIETLKMKVEKLDEDVLLKEGQLTILQESLNA